MLDAKAKRSRLCFFLFATAGVWAASGMANAQTDASGDYTLASASQIPRFVMGENGTLVPAGFNPRGSATVYSPAPAGTPVVVIASPFAGMSLAGEDVNFAPGPWANARGRISTITVPIRRAGGSWAITNADLVVEIHDVATRSANPMLASPPISRVAVSDVGAALYASVPASTAIELTVNFGDVQVPGDSEIFVTCAWHQALPGDNNAGEGPLLPGPTLAPPLPVTVNHPFSFWGWLADGPSLVGATSNALCMDWNSNAVLNGGPEVTVTWPGYYVNGAVSDNENRLLSPAVRLAIGIVGTGPQVGCDSIDFNNNTVFPEDQDVIDFFTVLAGGVCATCNDIDFNNNTVFPEDQDVIDFFNVLAGGECP